MTATNHALTGAVIAVAVDKPLLVAPIAFLSHFLLDVLPHYGEPHTANRPRGDFFIAMLIIDAVLLVGILAALFALSPDQLGLIVVGMVAAMSPDIAWVYRFIVQESWGKKRPRQLGTFNRFHANIQWGERHYGWIFELVWFFMISSVLITYLV